jgi:hypothetical protein
LYIDGERGISRLAASESLQFYEHPWEASMRWRSTAFGFFLTLALCLFALPLHAQTVEATTKPALHPWYDLTQEITLTGTVSSVVKSPTREMKMLGGSHLLVETTSGAVDASLGASAMRGKQALFVTTGERVQITGVMKTVGDRRVLIARLVLAHGHVFQIRNEHGFAFAPVSRKAGAASKVGQL